MKKGRGFVVVGCGGVGFLPLSVFIEDAMLLVTALDGRAHTRWYMAVSKLSRRRTLGIVKKEESLTDVDKREETFLAGSIKAAIDTTGFNPVGCVHMLKSD